MEKDIEPLIEHLLDVLNVACRETAVARREVALMKELGLPLVAPKGAVIEPEPKPGDAPQVPNGNEGDEEDEGNSQPAKRGAGQQRAA